MCIYKAWMDLYHYLIIIGRHIWDQNEDIHDPTTDNNSIRTSERWRVMEGAFRILY